MTNTCKLPAAITVLALTVASGCNAPSDQPAESQYGTNPALPAPDSSLIPTVNVAEADPWPDGTLPVPADGTRVTEFARDLDHPRWLYELPNGDVLVAESNSPAREGGGIRGFFMRVFMQKAGAGSISADRITLLRDEDQDGVADRRSVLIDNLFSPFGMTLIDGTLYIANADGIVSVPYSPNVTRIDEQPTDFFALPGGLNHHWTKNIIAGDDGETIYAAVGSNSNVGENGLDMEQGRAAIWKIDIASASGKVYADGIRNPVGMDFYEPTGTLYTVVNERDELGNDLVPDYLTSVSEGDFYGWPWSYFGDNVDNRVAPPRPNKVEQARVPDYALGSHTASLGLDLVNGKGNGMNSRFGAGAFIGQHGSWNRKPRSGYKVVFIPFRNGQPDGAPVDVLTGFLDGDTARGRPVGAIVDQRGGLLVADDVGNRIWRVGIN